MLLAYALALVGCIGFATAEEPPHQAANATEQHEFLSRFAGQWEFDGEAYLQPDQPPEKSTGKMTGRMIGGLWAVVDVTGEMVGHPYHGQGTFGYDSKKQKYIGTWVDSMSEFIWRYEGVADGNKLVLLSSGPNPAEPDKMLNARDTWEFTSDDEVLLTGEFEGPDGKMMTVMKATCRRVK
jgi:hypothetical protein